MANQEGREGGGRPERDRHAISTELIQHAVRCWEAEVENARRHAARLNLLLPAVLAVLGFGAFNLGSIGRDPAGVEPAHLVWVVRVLLLGSLLLFMRALWILLAIRQLTRPRPSASDLLKLSKQNETDPVALDDASARKAAFERTYAAAADLRWRNSGQGRRIDQGQQSLLVAILLALAAVACYTVLGSISAGIS
jgi:hypothetical protein